MDERSEQATATAPDRADRGTAARGPRGSRGEVRQRITAAALRSFADHGIDGVSTRSIAQAADCDPALVRYYFSSKQELFDQVTRRPEALDAQLATMAALPHAERAAYLADVVESCWDDPATRDFWRSLLRSSRTDAAVARQVEDAWADFVALGTARAATTGAGRPAGRGDAAWPVEVAEGVVRDGDDVGLEAAGGGAVRAPDRVRTGRDAAAPLASRRLVDPEDAYSSDVVPDDVRAPAGGPAGARSGDERERTVTALTSITGMLTAVHLWRSERAGVLGGQGRASALERVLVACFGAPQG